MISLSPMTKELNEKARGRKVKGLCFYGDLPPITRPCVKTLYLRAYLRKYEPAPESLVSAEQARAEGYAI